MRKLQLPNGNYNKNRKATQQTCTVEHTKRHTHLLAQSHTHTHTHTGIGMQMTGHTDTHRVL